MDRNEREIIDGLFAKIGQAEAGSGPRDPEAERHIAGLVAARPAAPYYMAQAILVQEEALKAAQAKIEELGSRPAGGGFLGGLFGGGQPAAPRPAMPQARTGASPWGGRPNAGAMMARGGSGFLGGAMQTALGVAGGVVLGNMLADAFTGDEAAAAESHDEAPSEEDAGFDDGGFDMGDE
ncbi:MAG: DUF2076 domain-containing protein [Geminicoccaceae bacterium]|nr:DUF2076 domain-containing protein [Geminicoccaceae bacterium]